MSQRSVLTIFAPLAVFCHFISRENRDYQPRLSINTSNHCDVPILIKLKTGGSILNYFRLHFETTVVIPVHIRRSLSDKCRNLLNCLGTRSLQTLSSSAAFQTCFPPEFPVNGPYLNESAFFQQVLSIAGQQNNHKPKPFRLNAKQTKLHQSFGKIGAVFQRR